MYTHKHIGGSLNPAPVDLANHVTGKLSGDNIENVDLNNFIHLPFEDFTQFVDFG